MLLNNVYLVNVFLFYEEYMEIKRFLVAISLSAGLILAAIIFFGK